MARMLASGEVAQRLGVTAKTVGRWARQGKIRAFITLGGHRRYLESDVNALVREEGKENV